eukprot:Hpha_TRINITY_DN33740_c0_g1::TRINITY_DN33740_c0_g1_i1::g.25151::m.25151/K03858/PIGH, GPI15; phosphatidylinositol glycan, class H
MLGVAAVAVAGVAAVWDISVVAVRVLSCIAALLLLRWSTLPQLEEVTIAGGVGVQARTVLNSGVVARSHFVPAESIQSVVIHEGYRGMRVVTYLALRVDGEERLFLPFKEVLPPLRGLHAAYKALQHHRFGAPRDPPASWYERECLDL